MTRKFQLRQIGKLEQYFFLTIGVFIMAFAFYFFVIPSGIVTGGVTGLSTVINRYLEKVPISLLALLFNIILLFFALIFLGKREFVRSIYGSFLFPVFLALFELTITNPTFGENDLLLVALYAGGLIGIGFAIVVHYGGTTGGTDILIKIMRKYTFLSLAVCVYVVDSTVIVIGALTYPAGLSEGFINALYAIVIVFLSGKVADSFLLGMQSKKAINIVTDHPKELKAAIFATFSRGMTEIQSQGGYTEHQKTLLIMVIQNSEYHYVRQIISDTDPKAFVFATPASEIHGEWSTKEEVFLNRDQSKSSKERQNKI